MEKIIDRIYKYIDYKGVKPVPFERKIGLSNGYLSKQFNRKADIGESILFKIIENCPDIDAIWLLTGKGNMLNKENHVALLSDPTENYHRSENIDYKTKYYETLEKLVDTQEKLNQTQELLVKSQNEFKELMKELDILKDQGGKDIVVGA